MALLHRGMTPLWIRAAVRYEARFPNHRGKATLLRSVFRLRSMYRRPIPVEMKNGAVVAVDPGEFSQRHSISWRCVVDREWEAAIERVLRATLAAGDCAIDVGANLGYFSAVMAQAVGAGGEVAAFEPVPTTFERLRLTCNWSGLTQVRPFNLAVGAVEGVAGISFARASSGQASMTGSAGTELVPVTTIDRLVGTGAVRPPRFIKIDVEGFELAVLRGAGATLARHRPTVVFELNGAMMRAAGWSAGDLAEVFARAGPYEFRRIGDDLRVDLGRVGVAADQYIDILATCPR